MAKIARKTQKIFAGSAANIGEFGSLQDGTKVLSTDPAAIQTSHWVQGLSAAVVSGQNLPALEEMNGINFVETYQLAYLFQEGIPEYDAGTNYFINSIVKAPGTYQLYGSKIDNNLGNSLATTADWQFLVDLSNPESNIVWGGTAGGSANTITITPTSALPAYVTPTIVMFLPASNNTGATTLNISGLGAKNITKGGTQALSANDIEAGKLVFMIYDGTQFQLINLPTFSQGADVASAGTLVLNGTGGDILNITGTTTITAVTLNQGRYKVCRFTGAVTLTNGASLVIPGSANYTTAANDIVIFISIGNSGVVYAAIFPASGKAVISPANATTSVAGVVILAAAGDMNPPSSTTKVPSVSVIKNHPGVAKAWVNFVGSSGTINASYNVSSVTRNTTGDYTVAFTTAMADANYCVMGSAQEQGGSVDGSWNSVKISTTPSTTSFTVRTWSSNNTVVDAPANYLTIMGN